MHRTLNWGLSIIGNSIMVSLVSFSTFFFFGIIESQQCVYSIWWIEKRIRRGRGGAVEGFMCT